MPDDSKMTPALRRLNQRVARWRAASGAVTVGMVGALVAHVAQVAARLAFA